MTRKFHAKVTSCLPKLHPAYFMFLCSATYSFEPRQNQKEKKYNPNMISYHQLHFCERNETSERFNTRGRKVK